MERLTKAELVNGFPVCYPNNCSGLPEFVTKGNPYRNIVERLKAYEDLEEQAKLLKLPCAVGDTVWYWDEEYDPIEEAPFEGYVLGYEIDLSGIIYILIRQKTDFIPAWNDDTKWKLEIGNFGKTVFFTREEAEAALKELEEE